MFQSIRKKRFIPDVNNFFHNVLCFLKVQIRKLFLKNLIPLKKITINFAATQIVMIIMARTISIAKFTLIFQINQDAILAIFWIIINFYISSSVKYRKCLFSSPPIKRFFFVLSGCSTKK